MSTNLEDVVKEYSFELDGTGDLPAAMRRAVARILGRPGPTRAAIEAEVARRVDPRRAELATLPDVELALRARRAALPWRAQMIEQLAQHEVRSEMHLEMWGEVEP